MSLAIEVTEVLRANVRGIWHDVDLYKKNNKLLSSFCIDAYEFVKSYGTNGIPLADPYLVHGGGQSDICPTGFSFVDADTGLTVSGPLTSLDAVMTVYSDEEIYEPVISKGTLNGHSS